MTESHELNHSNPLRIVPAMKRIALPLALTLVFSLPLCAQSSQFGLLFGGSKRVNDIAGSQGQNGINDFKFDNSVKEVYYATEVDPGTMFKIKLGEIEVPLAVTTTGSTTKAVKGTVDHADAIIDYRFSEPFGSTGIFGGLGMYRQSVTGKQDETNFGLSAGVNGDFPLSRRYGVVIEGAYHWVHMTERQRFLTLTAGIRVNF